MALEQTSIEHENNESGGRFFIENAAQLSYRWDGVKTMVVDHTTVDRELRGQGIAERLYSRMVDYARENQLRVVPVCSYIANMFEKHPEDTALLG
jgi:predicted GNAT family acetyltransferase